MGESSNQIKNVLNIKVVSKGTSEVLMTTSPSDQKETNYQLCQKVVLGKISDKLKT